MGYLSLSCRAESVIATSSSSSKASKEKEKEKNIKIQEFQYSDLEAATNGFSDRKLLGKGSHGYVYKAVVHGRPVAVKRPSRRPITSSEVDNEIDILSKIQSPRLVNLVGFANTNDSKDRLLVVEFMSNGTLYDVLHSSPRPPNWGRRIRLALQTAKAILTLHSSSPPVIHRDIKSANVLIDRSYNARLGDFGLALQCHVDDYRLRSTPPAGTIGYLDPCYVTPDNLSTKTDVFSFGILLLEIISGRKAIDITYSPPSIVDWAIPLIKKGKLMAVYDPRIAPPKDLLVRKHLCVIAAKCVRSCRERRPSMNEVVNWLCGLCKLVPLHSWNGFNNPCMMVEAVGRPVEARNGSAASRIDGVLVDEPKFESFDHRLSKNAMRDSRRVYSDLGFSSNLMDLMASTSEEPEFLRDADADAAVEGGRGSKSSEQGSSSRFGSGRYFMRGRNLYMPCGSDKDVFGLSKGHILGEASKQLQVDGVSRSNLDLNLNSLAAEVI